MRAWLAEVRRRTDVALQVEIYPRLLELAEFYSEWVVVTFDSDAAVIFKSLRQQRIRVATQDLKIASIALAHNALLLSANLGDFRQVPGLCVEDWLYGHQS